MKAISLKQPWANWVALGLKTLETRTWRTNYRGPLLICASMNVDDDAFVDGINAGIEGTDSQPRGMAIAQCDLVDCRHMTKADECKAMCNYEPGRYVFVLRNTKPIAPFSVKGRLGLFDVAYQEAYA